MGKAYAIHVLTVCAGLILIHMLAGCGGGGGGPSVLSEKIAFESDRDGNREIYVMNSDGSGQTNLTNNSADDQRAAFGIASP